MMSWLSPMVLLPCTMYGILPFGARMGEPGRTSCGMPVMRNHATSFTQKGDEDTMEGLSRLGTYTMTILLGSPRSGTLAGSTWSYDNARHTHNPNAVTPTTAAATATSRRSSAAPHAASDSVEDVEGRGWG